MTYLGNFRATETNHKILVVTHIIQAQNALGGKWVKLHLQTHASRGPWAPFGGELGSEFEGKVFFSAGSDWHLIFSCLRQLLCNRGPPSSFFTPTDPSLCSPAATNKQGQYVENDENHRLSLMPVYLFIFGDQLWFIISNMKIWARSSAAFMQKCRRYAVSSGWSHAKEKGANTRSFIDEVKNRINSLKL